MARSRYFNAGKKAGEACQDEFDRSGGRNRNMPACPHREEPGHTQWQAGFDATTEEARRAMTCADCNEELAGYEEQVCTSCLEKHEARERRVQNEESAIGSMSSSSRP